MDKDLNSEKDLRSLFLEIIRGYSEIEYDNQVIYLKHLNNQISSILDNNYRKYIAQAKDKGVPIDSERELSILNEGWTKELEEDLRNQGIFLAGLKKNKENAFREAETKAIKAKLAETEEKIHNLQKEKRELKGLTAELWATKKINEDNVYLLLFKEPELKTPYFTEEEFINLDNNDLIKLIGLINQSINDFTQNKLQKIALTSNFLELFNLSNENAYYFYGKAIVGLSFYQSSIFGYGKYFRNMLSSAETPPPQEILDDPDRLIEWCTNSKNAQKALGKQANDNDGARSVTGVSTKEMEKLGLVDNNTQVIDINKEIKKRGNMNLEEIMALHQRMAGG